MTRTFWLSFSAGKEKPPGQRFLGAVVVDVTSEHVAEAVRQKPELAASKDQGWAATAIALCWSAGVNPGGSVAFVCVPQELAQKVLTYPRLKLMQHPEIDHLEPAP